MGMTLKGKRRGVIQALERKISDGWMPKDDVELEEMAEKIVSLSTPSDITALSKLLVENPSELCTPELCDILYKNLKGILKDCLVERFSEFQIDVEKAREEYESAQYGRVVERSKIEV